MTCICTTVEREGGREGGREGARERERERERERDDRTQHPNIRHFLVFPMRNPTGCMRQCSIYRALPFTVQSCKSFTIIHEWDNWSFHNSHSLYTHTLLIADLYK